MCAKRILTNFTTIFQFVNFCEFKKYGKSRILNYTIVVIVEQKPTIVQDKRYECGWYCAASYSKRRNIDKL